MASARLALSSAPMLISEPATDLKWAQLFSLTTAETALTI
jgi:hypothetical protein